MAQPVETKLRANRKGRKQAPRRIWNDYRDGEQDAWYELEEDDSGGRADEPIDQDDNAGMEADEADEAAYDDDKDDGNKTPGKRNDPNGRMKKDTWAASETQSSELETRTNMVRKKKSRSYRRRKSRQEADAVEMFPQEAEDSLPDWFRRGVEETRKQKEDFLATLEKMLARSSNAGQSVVTREKVTDLCEDEQVTGEVNDEVTGELRRSEQLRREEKHRRTAGGLQRGKSTKSSRRRKRRYAQEEQSDNSEHSIEAKKARDNENRKKQKQHPGRVKYRKIVKKCTGQKVCRQKAGKRDQSVWQKSVAVHTGIARSMKAHKVRTAQRKCPPTMECDDNSRRQPKVAEKRRRSVGGDCPVVNWKIRKKSQSLL